MEVIKLIVKVIYDRIVLFDSPGGTRYVDFLYKGEYVKVLKGWSHEERTWKDKKFCEVETGKNKVGYVLAAALRPLSRKDQIKMDFVERNAKNETPNTGKEKSTE